MGLSSLIVSSVETVVAAVETPEGLADCQCHLQVHVSHMSPQMDNMSIETNQGNIDYTGTETSPFFSRVSNSKDFLRLVNPYLKCVCLQYVSSYTQS